MPSNHPIYQLSSDIVDELAALYPDGATFLGVEGHDHRWPDLSPEGGDAASDALQRLRAQVRALPEATDHWDHLAVEVADAVLTEELEWYQHGDHLKNLDSMASPAQDFRAVFDHMRRDTVEHWENIATRLESLDDALGGYTRSLDTGRKAGTVVAKRQVEAVATQADVHASDSSALIALSTAVSEVPLDPKLIARVERAVASGRVAFASFADYLRNQYLPGARETDAVGEDAYVRNSGRFLGTLIDPRETYDWGWNEVAELRTAMEKVAAEIRPGASIAEVLGLLKTDPKRQAPDPETFCTMMQDRSNEALEKLSGTHFDVPDQIRNVAVKLAPPGGPLGAYYVGPSEDFTREGTLWWALEEDIPVPLYDQVSTAYHEGFPGHHLQVGVQVSLADNLSRLHRLWMWKPGTGEGWALYAERLMDELGYLEEPDYVFGFLASQMLRACRVVIDIGSHLELTIPSTQPFHPGEPWRFETGVEMLMDYATLSRSYAESEMTRYLGWPGQAIAYKVGERSLLETRRELERRRGSAFDLKAFHRDLLEVGPVGIDLMQRVMLDNR